VLLKLETKKLQPGMFVSAIEGSWLDNPFWRPQFLLTKPGEIDRLVESGIEWVTIDDSRGKGIPLATEATDSVARPMPNATRPARPSFGKRTPPPVAAFQENGRTPLSERERKAEYRRASSIVNRSKTVVMGMFDGARLGNAVKASKVAPLVEKITASVDVDPMILLNIARLKNKDEYTYLHSVAVCTLMVHLARELRLPEQQVHDLGVAGMLHDIGKTAIPESILQKTEMLDEAEWDEIRDHPKRGHEILSASHDISEAALEVCLRHHERMDGTGYPGKIPGESLSLAARMSSICDVYDAVTSRRSYNDPWSASDALAKMESWAGQFDKLLLRTFVKSLGILPVGTLVRLNYDQLAVVIGESPADFTAPVVRAFHCYNTRSQIPFQDIDTGSDRSRIVLNIEEPASWDFTDWPTLSARLISARTD
jgi:HD-GYP domain-containing protein (c-di-GMP phosphodiesterase class II)